MKRLLIALPLLFLTACAYTGELSEEELILAAGYDGSQLTAATQEKVYGMTGGSFAEAVNRLARLPKGGEASFSHTACLMITEETDLGELLDYIERSNDFRLKTEVFLLEKADISQVFSETDDISRVLGALAKESRHLRFGRVFSAEEIAIALSRSGVCLLSVIENVESAPVPTGLAVYGEGGLIERLGTGASAGAALIMGRVQSRELSLGGAELTLRSPRVTIKNGQLTLRCEAELLSKRDDGPVDVPALEDGAAELLRRELEEALEAQARLGLDFMDLAGETLSFRPPEISSVRVTVTLRRTGDLKSSVPRGGGGHD